MYPLYALFFTDTGISRGQLSALFVIWSVTGLVAEIPAGALADRFSRKKALALAGILQALGHGAWIAFPGFTGFAAGFVLWGLGGSFVSGAFEALLFEGLEAEGASHHYARVAGLASSAALAAQAPVALSATLLFQAGGYQLAGWVSVGSCLVAALMATALPDVRTASPEPSADDPASSYTATLRRGLKEAAANRGVRTALLALAALGGIDALEEYLGVVIREWGVPTSLVPVASLGIPLAGALGAALGGRANRLSARSLGIMLGLAFLSLAAMGALARPIGIAGLAAFYALYQAVLVVAGARLQERIEGPRATVTSVASLGVEVVGIGLFGLWALGGIPAAAMAGLAVAFGLTRWLRPLP
ncbi:MAG: MFS transporter [Actinomycetota bacterium]